MRKLFGFLIIIAAIYGGWELYLYYKDVETKTNAANGVATGTPAAPAPAAAGTEVVIPQESLAGLPPALEATLKTAREQGVGALGAWLKKYRYAVKDPRLAAIELDYVVLMSQRDPVEAKKVFLGVKARTPANSPLYPRVKKLEKAYE